VVSNETSTIAWLWNFAATIRKFGGVFLKVGVAGAGAVGCHYGSMLQRAGVDVAYLARGEHLEVLQRDGLTHVSGGRTEQLKVSASDDAKILADCDAVLLACKTTGLAAMCEQIVPFIGKATVLMAMQNGVAAPDIVAGYFPENPLLAASAFIGARIESPGVVIHSAAGHLRLGMWGDSNGRSEEVMGELIAAWNRSGVDAQEVADMRAMLWHKMLWNCGFNAITALTRRYARDIAADSDSARWVREAMAETAAVAEALGVTLPADAAEQHMQLTMKAGEVKTSMWQDMEHGHRTEIEAMNGHVVELGRELGIATPTNDLLASLIRAAER